ncbi:hypothetical protein [Dehalobacter sp.]|uniref:hypothetical protein n=1 Tax=Dehalobacter sp. TaxID=1962289 RepID=UPI002582F66C|nr:hypothetical protein [Dehalobacter sp.]MDJ0305397.1 hypothetical protein [Dehalobacter sp.]
MAWVTPKTDWTANNYYNYGDLNRVEGNINAMVDLINTYASITGLTSITNRDITSFEFYDSLNRIEQNVLALKNATFEPLGWITPKTDWHTLDPFDYTDANRLESNLLALYIMVNKIKAYLKYCGTYYCGQDPTYL